MSGLRFAGFVIAAGLAILAMVWPGWHPAGIAPQRKRALASYVASLILGIVVILLAPLGHSVNVPFFAAVALVAWVLLGALWVARRYPGIPQPEWALRPWSVADWGLVGIVVLSLGVAAFG